MPVLTNNLRSMTFHYHSTTAQNIHWRWHRSAGRCWQNQGGAGFADQKITFLHSTTVRPFNTNVVGWNSPPRNRYDLLSAHRALSVKLTNMTEVPRKAVGMILNNKYKKQQPVTRLQMKSWNWNKHLNIKGHDMCWKWKMDRNSMTRVV